MLVQVSLLAALGTLNTAIINPAYSQLATEFNISIVQASYQTTVVVALNGVGAFLWIPLANVYGRRPIYLFTTLLGFASALGSAYALSYGQLLGARVVNGLFPAALALGPSTVVDCFFHHQRGRAMGLFTVVLTSGAHIAPIVGGLVGQFLGWRWIFRLAAIMDGVMFLIILLGLPETLYVRDPSSTTALLPTSSSSPLPLSPPSPQSIHTETRGEYEATPSSVDPTKATKTKSHYLLSRLRLYAGPFPGGPKLQPSDFVWPALRMAKYPSVLFPAIYYSAQYGFASILPAVTVAAIFKERFGWNTLEIGLAYGGALTIGGLLGESVSGVILDAIVMKRTRVRQQKEKEGDSNNSNKNDVISHRNDPEPEARLQAIWTGAVLVPAGLLIYGFTIQYRVHWFVPLFGMAVGVFGLQPIATTCYTYSIDCYQDRGADVATLFNFVRQAFGLTFAFYVVLLCERIGYQVAFVLFVIWGSVLGFIPILVLMWKGREMREWLEKREQREITG